MRTTIHFACVFGIVFAMHTNANCAEVQTYPGVAISPEWAFPANGSDAFAIDLSFTTVSRNSVAGCGVSFGKSEYKSLYGVQVALLNAYVQNDMYGLQFGAATSVATRTTIRMRQTPLWSQASLHPQSRRFLVRRS